MLPADPALLRFRRGNLVVSDALGRSIRFAEGEGQRLDSIKSVEDLAKLTLNRTRTTNLHVFAKPFRGHQQRSAAQNNFNRTENEFARWLVATTTHVVSEIRKRQL